VRELRACDRCLARSWLLSRLAAHLEPVRARVGALLPLPDDDLIAAVGGGHQAAVNRERAELDLGGLRARIDAGSLDAICRHDARYPSALRELENPPATLFIAGGLERLLTLVASDSVALVGSRRASDYGRQLAGGLGRGLAAAGVTVISGLALGIDAAAHAGALEGGGATVAVLPGSAERPYPASKSALYRRLIHTGAGVSELPPGTRVWRWMFPARNRIIAGLAAMTVVVEAASGSGALLTAACARELGRPIGAVPGRVTQSEAAGPNELLTRGAAVIRGADDVLDQLFGAGCWTASTRRPDPAPELRPLLAALAEGHDTGTALARAGLSADAGLAALAALELSGHVRREPGGRFSVTL
jgi:DNA processing protein